MEPDENRAEAFARACREARVRYPAAFRPSRPAAPVTDRGLVARLWPEGLPEGTLVEVGVGPRPGGGRGCLLQAILSSLRGGCRWLGWVDPSDAFDPESVPAALRERFLWIRPPGGLLPSLMAADLLLRDGNFAWVGLDLADFGRRAWGACPAHGWYRLQRQAARHGCNLLVWPPAGATVPAAGERLLFTTGWTTDDLASSPEELASAVMVERPSSARPALRGEAV